MEGADDRVSSTSQWVRRSVSDGLFTGLLRLTRPIGSFAPCWLERAMSSWERRGGEVLHSGKGSGDDAHGDSIEKLAAGSILDYCYGDLEGVEAWRL